MVCKPADMTFEEAAAIPQGGVIALNGIRERGGVHPGQKILINGAGGSAGTFAVQLAKLQGAEVTGVDNSGKLDFLQSLGADHVIGYTREDFTKTGKEYDLILDLIVHRSVFSYMRALKSDGTYFFVGGYAGKVRPVIDRKYLFEEIPEAMRYVGEGRAKGKVVITVQQAETIESHFL
jgi:NADPH:quinone reductase-like Zn-dependent oxidoreductase